jgi:hypothetical protein
LSDRKAVPDVTSLLIRRSLCFRVGVTSRTQTKKGTAPRSLLIAVANSTKKTPRLVAPLRLIGRRGRCRRRSAEGQLILLATEENIRQRLVTGLVGTSGIPTRGLGFV